MDGSEASAWPGSRGSVVKCNAEILGSIVVHTTVTAIPEAVCFKCTRHPHAWTLDSGHSQVLDPHALEYPTA
jgi:hypothetical protein